MASVDEETILNFAREVLLVQWNDLPDGDAERLLSELPTTLQRVFTQEVVSCLERSRLLEESVLRGCLGPPNVARVILEKITPLITPATETDSNHLTNSR
eukprot:g2775.t1